VQSVLARAEDSANKALLKAETERAAGLGIIGAPSLVTEDKEVFWGNDRLEQGLDWAADKRA
jgi:2-hydroxychromene-2-carboxylate isomerase